jgi:predicted enzyme related to lactoylglutathione lyase
MPEMDYRLVETGGAGGINGGILKPQRPEPWPGNMTFYIDVDDLADYRTVEDDQVGNEILYQ